MMDRIAALGADYVATIGALARTELGHDAARVRTALRAGALAAAVVAVGALWLNVALLLWLLTTPYPIVGALVVGIVALAIGLAMAARARRGAESLRMLEATRRVLAEEIGSRDPAAAHVPPAPMMPAEASARLREIRAELRETVALHRGPQGEPEPEVPGVHFEPRSRTMRTAMWLWRAIPRVPAGTALLSALGVLAVSSPKLRRLLAVVALVRNLGGHPRHAGHAGPMPYPYS